MASTNKANTKISMAVERTGQWVFFQDIPTDVVVVVREASFSLHKFMLVAKCSYIRNLILESKEADLARINLSDIPGGPEIFEKAARFCYGVNFEITVHNVAALRCAADYLQMSNKYCDNNLAGRTEDFLAQVALLSLSGATVVLKSCQDLLPVAEQLQIVQRCVDVVSSKACSEANFPSRSPPNWWAEELSILDVESFSRVSAAMKQRGAKAMTLANALITYAETVLRDLVRDQVGNGSKTAEDCNNWMKQREVLESVVALLPSKKASLPINFLCCLLRCAIFLNVSTSCKNELEKRIAAILELVTVDDLLVLSFSYDGERLLDQESVRRIISEFFEKEKSAAVFNAVSSGAMQMVAKTVDAYLGDIATYDELSISKFNGIANLIPKEARKVEDNLYRAIDIYLKWHPNLDEIEREKVCSVMDPMKLSYEARVHVTQNKRMPVQIVIHVLYYDQLKRRSGMDYNNADDAAAMRTQVQADVSLMKENEALHSELIKMKLFITDMHKNGGYATSSTKGGSHSIVKPNFLSSMSKTLGKLNPFL